MAIAHIFRTKDSRKALCERQVFDAPGWWRWEKIDREETTAVSESSTPCPICFRRSGDLMRWGAWLVFDKLINRCFYLRKENEKRSIEN